MANTTATTEEQLIERYIEPNPNKPGADEVRIKGRGTSVWAIIGYLGAGNDDDIKAIAEGFRIPVDAVRAAIAYYRRHKEVLDNRLAANGV